MTRKTWIISICIGIVLGLLGGFAGIPQLLQAKSVNASSTVDEVLEATLNSYLKWDTVQGEAEIIWYSPQGETQGYINSFVIEQPNRAHFFVRSMDGTGLDSEWISDGENGFDIDPVTKKYSSASLPAFSKDFSKLPTSLEEAKTSFAIYRHPFAMIIPCPVAEYLYPQWMSQGKGIHELVGEETLLGRKVWVVTYGNYNGEVNAWVDKETGIILKYVQKTDGKLDVEMEFIEFTVNSEIDASAFEVPSEIKSID